MYNCSLIAQDMLINFCGVYAMICFAMTGSLFIEWLTYKSEMKISWIEEEELPAPEVEFYNRLILLAAFVLIPCYCGIISAAGIPLTRLIEPMLHTDSFGRHSGSGCFINSAMLWLLWTGSFTAIYLGVLHLLVTVYDSLNYLVAVNDTRRPELK